MTAPESRAFEPLASPAEQAAAKKKMMELQIAVASGKSGEFRFTAQELNAWFFSDGDNADLARFLRFRTEDNWLGADVSLPLQFMNRVPFLPSFKDRFFNGRIAGRFTLENGKLKLDSFDLVGNGRRLPWLFTGQSYKVSVSAALQNGIEARVVHGREILDRLESIKVENGEIVFRLRAS